MNDKLSNHVDALRHELNELQMAFVNGNNKMLTDFIGNLDGLRNEIDELDSFVVQRGDERCQTILRKKMSAYLSKSDTRTLILDIGLDFEFDNDTLANLHWALIKYCVRRDALPDLLAYLRDHRPRVHWPEC